MSVAELDWTERAACRGADTAIFYPDNSDDAAYERARSICATCPVVPECLRAAMVEEVGNRREGMRGGLTPFQRRRLASVERSARPPTRLRSCHSCFTRFLGSHCPECGAVYGRANG